ncbi:MAG: flagellin hook IN motif-containing protein, partial [Pseudomonadota bacterium]
LADGATGSAVDAINARSAETGVTATIDPTTGALSLSAAGTISVSDMAREDGAPGALATATEPGEPPQPIVSSADTRDGVLDRLKEARSTFIDQRTEVGALAANASRQTDVITSRQTDMDLAISGLEDLDLAAALTRLQQLLLTRDASQQTYAKITQQTLFDYIR